MSYQVIGGNFTDNYTNTWEIKSSLGRIAVEDRREPDEPPVLVLHRYRARVCVSDTIQYQGGPKGFSL